MSDNEITSLRLEKLQQLRDMGLDPYSIEVYQVDHFASELLDNFEKMEGQSVSFAGRVVSLRIMGKAAFAHISDGDARIQAYFKRDDIGDRLWEAFQLIDIGDHIGLKGELFLTKTGERSIHAFEFTPLSKALHVLPIGKEKEGEQWYGLSDVDARYRHRHLDLVVNRESREKLLNRSRIVRAVRSYFDNLGYIEVETPMLQIEAGGAAARPFLTHYNAYDLDVKLRISLELYLKRVICGDVPAVYELGRVFRNEGVSNRHNPEFTMLEFYEAYVNLETMMERVEGVFRRVAQEVFGSTAVEVSGQSVDFGKPWKRLDLMEAIKDKAGVDREELQDLASAKAALDRLEIESAKENNLGGIIEKLLEKFVEPTLIEPTFIVGYPIETSPLAKKDPERPGITRRFEGYVGGREVCNAFSEINDPIDQRERFEAQLAERKKGDDEAHPMDEEFLYALETGMPPTGGCGIGIDRMVMLLTGAEHLREVLLFPMMRPE